MNVLLKVSGSIAIYKICSLVSSLVKLGHNVKVASSESALNFVGSSLWEGLSGNKVFTNDFTPGQRMEHIRLNDWADVVVLAPASAQSLNAVVTGVGSSVITTLFLARKREAPYLIFPAMNPRMWSSEIVQKSVEQLNSYEGVEVFNPDSGPVACGHVGEGRLAEPSFILNEILNLDVNKKRTPKKVLVSFGGTAEDIDGVRQITNFSSGRTGLKLCSDFRKTYQVTALGSEASLKGAEGLEGVQVRSFLSSEDLASQMKTLLSAQEYDLIVHAAAISDFIPESNGNKKISSNEDFKINFTKAPKILNSLKDWSKNKGVKIVSFKLTHNQTTEEVIEKIESQFLNTKTDFIVHNELSDISLDEHKYRLWKRNEKKPFSEGLTKEDMASDIISLGGI